MHRLYSLVAFALVLSAPVVAGAPSYSGQQTREIKALSPEELDDYLTGKGMGFAKAAELNGYPGPAHVLQLASDLQLSAEQRARTEALQTQMRSRAVAAGRGLIDAEKALDRLFAMKTVTPDRLQRAVQDVAARQAQVRLAHLETHLAQAAILTPEQIAKYNELRGYGAAREDHTHHHGADGL